MKYLNYWWDRKSVIDPTCAESNYYAVSYDHKGRMVKIAEYNKGNDVLNYEYFHWKGSWPVKEEHYLPNDILKYKVTYQYNKFGFLIKEKIVSADGTVTSVPPHHEEYILDKIDGWLSPLLMFPIVEMRGIINYMKGLFVSRKRD